jgi:hypothetical protein
MKGKGGLLGYRKRTSGREQRELNVHNGGLLIIS